MLDFHYFDTLDSVASKMKDCIANTYTQFKSYLQVDSLDWNFWLVYVITAASSNFGLDMYSFPTFHS